MADCRCLTGCGNPAHQKRDGAYNRAHPGVDDRDSFQNGVDTGIEEDVEGGQNGYGSIGAEVEACETRSCASDGKQESGAG